MTDTYDVSTVEVSDTFDVEILHPKTQDPMIVGGETTEDPETGAKKTTGGKPMTVTVFGPGSKVFKAAQSVQSNRAIARFKAKGKGESTPEEDAANTARFLSACTVSFNNFGYKGMEAGREMFRALYLDPKMGWLTEQVNKEMGDWSNFTTAA